MVVQVSLMLIGCFLSISIGCWVIFLSESVLLEIVQSCGAGQLPATYNSARIVWSSNGV